MKRVLHGKFRDFHFLQLLYQCEQPVQEWIDYDYMNHVFKEVWSFCCCCWKLPQIQLNQCCILFEGIEPCSSTIRTEEAVVWQIQYFEKDIFLRKEKSTEHQNYFDQQYFFLNELDRRTWIPLIKAREPWPLIVFQLRSNSSSVVFSAKAAPNHRLRL